MATCDCRSTSATWLIEDVLQAVREAARLFPEDERLREEERQLHAERARIEEPRRARRLSFTKGGRAATC